MKLLKFHLFLGLLVIFTSSAGSQTADEESARVRAEKIRTILTVTDLRSPHDGALYQYLSDPDTLVRKKATLAFGTLQDTAALTDLLTNLSEGPPSVREAAAFAIGQTAQMLSPAGRSEIAHELIWIRSEAMKDPGILLEEIGKFGDAQALTDIMLKFSTDPVRRRDHLFMSIARFGIRGITIGEAIRYLLGHLKNAPVRSWKAVYALQRIGDHEEIRNESEQLIPIAQDRDPLVRMNLAGLFGKLHTEGTLVEPLQKLADFDPDWRVRVNALKGLGNFQPDDETIGIFHRAFLSDNLHIALTALTVFGNFELADTGRTNRVRTAVGEIERMARNTGMGFRWQLQAAAAHTLAKLMKERALADIRPSGEEEPLLLAGLLRALGATGSPEALKEIMAYEDPDDPLVYRSVLEALGEIAAANSALIGLVDTVYRENLKGLRSGDMAVTTVAASFLGDSIFLRAASVPPLLEVLGELHAPQDIEAIQEICRTLAGAGDRRAIPVLEGLLGSRDAATARAAADALEALTGDDYGGQIGGEGEPLHVDLDFDFLDSLPDTIRIVLETLFGDIRIDLYKDTAPFTVMNILKLAENEGYYDGLIFHRVVPNFVIQGGDPRGDGWGGPGYSIRSEFSPLTYETGSVGIASAGKDTEGSQFFITHSPQPHLDGRYTVIGKVIGGMRVVNVIQVGDRIRGLRRIR